MSTKLDETPPEASIHLSDLIAGLTASPRTLPPALLYDDDGAELFDEITQLPEYYQTRTERSILKSITPDLHAALGSDLELVEYGAGSSEKTEILLEGLDVRTYRPIDVSAYYLENSARRVKSRFPELTIQPLHADFSNELDLGPKTGSERVGFFPGGTIGNLHPDEAFAFLRRIASMLGPGGHLILGVDLLKDPALLHAAYNDAQGVTARFNLGALRHLNRGYGADFDLERWRHYALFDPKHARIEMHLVPDQAQVVHLGGERLEFEAFETIWTECSYKFSKTSLRRMAHEGGFETTCVWTDPEQLFGVALLRVC